MKYEVLDFVIPSVAFSRSERDLAQNLHKTEIPCNIPSVAIDISILKSTDSH